MAVRELFKEVFLRNKFVSSREKRIKDLKVMQSKLFAHGGKRKGFNYTNDDLNKMIDEEMQSCFQCMKNLLEVQNKVESLINTLREPRQRVVMYERYINLKSWDDIADEYEYADYISALALQNKALKNLTRNKQSSYVK